MLRRLKSAYTLLEMMISLGIVFCAAAFLFSLYAFGARSRLSTDNYTTAVFLAQAKMDELHNIGVDKLAAVQQGQFAKPHDNFTWQAELTSFNRDFCLITLRVWCKQYPHCTLRRLGSQSNSASVAAHCYDSEVTTNGAASSACFSLRSYWNNALLGQSVGKLGKNWRTSIHWGYPGSGLVWLVDNSAHQIARLTFNRGGQNLTADKFAFPMPQQGYTPHLTGLAGDCMGSFVFCADSANRALWVLDDSQQSGHPVWQKDCFVSKKTPLSAITGITCTQYGDQVWLCEGSRRSLRQFFWGHKPAAAKEAAGSCGYWGDRIDIPYAGAGQLHDVAVNAWGSVLYTVDNQFVYVLIYDNGSGAGRWQKIELPLVLRQAGPKALWVDPGNSRLYVNTEKGKLWAACPKLDGTLTQNSFAQLR